MSVRRSVCPLVRNAFVKKSEIGKSTVWLFSFATFHDDVIQKVIKIIEFWKKFLKDYENTFYNISVKRSTQKNLILSTLNEPWNQIDKLANWKIWQNLSIDLLIFELLSFLNGLSYRCQIGLKWKIIWSSFKVCCKLSSGLMPLIHFIYCKQILMLNFQ